MLTLETPIGLIDLLAQPDGAPEYERQDATELAQHALSRTLTPSEVSGYWTNRALGFITSQPGA